MREKIIDKFYRCTMLTELGSWNWTGGEVRFWGCGKWYRGVRKPPILQAKAKEQST